MPRLLFPALTHRGLKRMQDISNANAPSGQVPAATIYGKLTQPFDTTFTDPRGFTYVTGEQVVSRLNDVFGPFGWSFEVVQQVHDQESDEIIVQGRMRVYDAASGNWIMREQFGSQKINRRRDSGAPVELGFDYKGATTDCLKKCASLFGVGLYLMAKEETTTSSRQLQRDATPRRGPQPTAVKPAGAQSPSTSTETLKQFACAECGAELKKVEFKGGDVWEPYELANKGLQNFKRILCMTHYRAANDAAKATQQAS